MKKLSLTLLAAVALAATAPRAHAAFLLTLSQVGANIVLSGTGTINTAALTAESGGAGYNFDPTDGIAIAGFAENQSQTYYDGITGPDSFGTGDTYILADSTTGITAGFVDSFTLTLESNYVSGTQITDSATFNNTTIAATGATPGVYVYTWGTGATADSLTLIIPAAVNVVPEPSTWTMLAAGAAGLGLVWRQRRRTA